MNDEQDLWDLRSTRRWHPLVRSLSARAGPPGIGRQIPRRLVLSPAHWGLIARTQTRIVHSPKAIFSPRVARTCRCVRWGASQSTQEGAIMPSEENKSGAQKAAEAEVESFRKDLGPFVVAAETSRMAMVFYTSCKRDEGASGL